MWAEARAVKARLAAVEERLAVMEHAGHQGPCCHCGVLPPQPKPTDWDPQTWGLYWGPPQWSQPTWGRHDRRQPEELVLRHGHRP